MNPTLELIHRHRSIRRYADDAVPEEHIREAVRAGQAASTSSAIQAYCLIRVTQPDRRETLVELTGNQTKVARAGAFFVVCGDTRRHRLLAARAGRPYRQRLEAFLLSVVDATLFAQNLVLAFESLGYGVCYIGGLRNRLPEVDRLLELPEGVYPLYGLCVGVPAETPDPRPRLPLDAVLFDDGYPDDEELLRLLDTCDAEWTSRIADKFSEARRTDLGEYYRRKGADFS
jgi:nitroreductase